MFVAVYWWRVHPGKEGQFRQAWRRGTEAITRIFGSCGSRLHPDRDGRFVGVAGLRTLDRSPRILAAALSAHQTL